MTSSAPDHVPVTLAEIARIAGVGRAAVSNWRRRHDSFPERIGGTDVSPQFSLAEIETWLRKNKKLQGAGSRDLLWPRFEALGSRDEAGLAIADAARRMRGGRARRRDPALSEPARELAAEVARMGRREGSEETFDFFLQRWLDAHVRQISTTPPPLAALMTRIAQRMRGNRGGEGGEVTVFDPACGTGHLLAAAAQWQSDAATSLVGCEKEPALAALASGRLAFATEGADTHAQIESADALRDDPYPELEADIGLCNPPFNERDWGYEELATDTRWSHGLPPRTEPELAWVQHLLAHLKPGGTAVVVLPPAVASRRAGRRIRGSLLRKGALRGVLALPPGCAQPHSVSLQLWVLTAPDDRGPTSVDDALLMDGTQCTRPTGPESRSPDWEALTSFVESAFDGFASSQQELPEHAARVPLLTLLDDEVDVTPGRYIAAPVSVGGDSTSESWHDMENAFSTLRLLAKELAALDAEGNGVQEHPTATVGDLAKAGALELSAGHQPGEHTSSVHEEREDAVPLLTVPDLLLDGDPSAWLVETSGHTVAEKGDVVVVGAVRAFDAWVHDGPPTALGPQLYALRVDPERLNAEFLAGCLRAPSNGRQAGTHASTSSRVDVRRLQVLQLPLDAQVPYGEAFQQIGRFVNLLARARSLGTGLAHDLNDRLATGSLGVSG